jgi:hypothetical protein
MTTYPRYSRGNRDEFVADLREVKSVFVDWRYAYEHELLCSSPDSLMVLANAFRDTIEHHHPDLHSGCDAAPIV